MRVYAIADLHMPGGEDTPMDIFGDNWEGHVEKIFSDWRERVTSEDVVLVPGDISWAMYLEGATEDLLSIAALPGKKVLLRGNHDYWWTSVSKLRALLPEDMYAVQNDAVDLGDFVVCGTRGWLVPGCGEAMSAQDEKVYKRECMRLELSLEAAFRIANGRPVIVMLHYPPLYPNARDTGFTQVLEKYPIDTVLYGHLHGKGIAAKFEGVHNGIAYHLVSCDSMDFRLKEIPIFPRTSEEESQSNIRQEETS